MDSGRAVFCHVGGLPGIRTAAPPLRVAFREIPDHPFRHHREHRGCALLARDFVRLRATVLFHGVSCRYAYRPFVEAAEAYACPPSPLPLPQPPQGAFPHSDGLFRVSHCRNIRGSCADRAVERFPQHHRDGESGLFGGSGSQSGHRRGHGNRGRGRVPAFDCVCGGLHRP
jgi:hypothetical protein